MGSAKTKRDDLIKENGRHYYRLCNKCRETKPSYKSSYCPKCQKERSLREKKTSKDLLESLERTTNSRKETNDVTMFDDIVRKKTFYDKMLVDFINRIERRNGIASMEDIFVTMITLYNFYGSNKSLDHLKTDLQLQMMYELLKEKKKKVEKMRKFKDLEKDVFID